VQKLSNTQVSVRVVYRGRILVLSPLVLHSIWSILTDLDSVFVTVL